MPTDCSNASLPSIEQLIAEGALFVINHSGGKDSQAMMIRLLAQLPREHVIVVHASLGEHEWEGALEHAQLQAVLAGVPFLVAKATKTFFDMVDHRYAVNPGPNSSCWPSSKIRQCTSDLKRDPIQREVRRYANAHGYTSIVSCLGMRAAESPPRAKMPTFKLNKRGCTKARRWYEWLPIHGMSTPDVFTTIAAAGQQPHWAYAAGNARLSCVFCVLGSPSDIANGKRHRPALFDQYRQRELSTGYTMHESRRSLDELVALGEQQLARRAPQADANQEGACRACAA